MSEPAGERIRVDKWLWAARFYKTRTLATEAVEGGHAQFNGLRVKPAKEVRAGDRINLVIGSVSRTLIVQGIAERRGSATVAATLYTETQESLLARERERDMRRYAATPEADRHGRPTKRDRRAIDQFRKG